MLTPVRIARTSLVMSAKARHKRAKGDERDGSVEPPTCRAREARSPFTPMNMRSQIQNNVCCANNVPAVSFEKRARAGSPSADRRERTRTYATEGGATADELLRRLSEETDVGYTYNSKDCPHFARVSAEARRKQATGDERDGSVEPPT